MFVYLVAFLLTIFALLVSVVLPAMCFFILIRVLISWFSPDPFNPFVIFLYRFTEPILGPIRKILPQMWPIDLSPMVACITIVFLYKFLLITLCSVILRLLP